MSRKIAPCYRLYVLLPAIVCSQILFVALFTRNYKSLRANPSQRRNLSPSNLASQQGDFVPSDQGSVGDNRTHELLERLKKEREEIEQRKKDEIEQRGKEESSPSQITHQADNTTKKEDWRPIIRTFAEGDKLPFDWTNFFENQKRFRDFVDGLTQQRDKLLEAALVATVKKTNEAKERNVIKHDLIKPPPDQSVNFSTPFLSPPEFHAATTRITILVPSHQGSFIKRQAIRETWKAANSDTSIAVLFVVAQSDCNEFDSDLHVDTQSLKSNSLTPACDQIDHSFLRLEQDRYHDLLEIPMKEKYSQLPEKMMQAYNWVFKNVPGLKWIAKADDDMFVHVQNLALYVHKYNHEVPLVLGEIIENAPVAKEGKWAEFDYPESHYPYWPRGSAGHILSRATLKYFIENSESLHRYQGEDTSIGIWLDEARKNGFLDDVTYIHAPKVFISKGPFSCKTEQNFVMVGHELTPANQLGCQELANNTGPLVNSWNDTIK